MGTHWTTKKVKDTIKKLFASGEVLTFEEIAQATGTTRKIVHKVVHEEFTKEEIAKHKHLTYRRSKLGVKNPMKGKCGKLHHNYVGECADGRGYLIVLKPEWYTGRKNSKHVFKHSVVVCENLGITEIPKGFVVHHIDRNPLNNSIHNLALVTTSGHSRIHHSVSLGSATTNPKGSRAEDGSKRVA